MKNDCDKDGLKMIDLSLLNKSLKTKWISKYLMIRTMENGYNFSNLNFENMAVVLFLK